MASKNTELKEKMEQTKREAFQKDLLAVEKKHGMKIIPMINYTSQGLYPTLGAEIVEEAKPKAEKVV